MDEADVPGGGLLTVVHRSIDGCAAADPSTVGLPERAIELVELRRAVDRLEALFLARLAGFDARGGAGNEQVAKTIGVPAAANTTVWLRRACHLTSAAAGSRLRLARQLRALPATMAAMGAGHVSYDHARVIAAGIEDVREPLDAAEDDSHLGDAGGEIGRIADHAGTTATTGRESDLDPLDPLGLLEVEGSSPLAVAERILVGAGTRLDPGQLRRVTVYLRQRVDPDGETGRAERAFDRRELFISPGLDGVHYLKGILDPEGAAALLTAINALCPAPAAGDTRTAPQRRADALTDLARLGLNSRRLPAVGGERPHLNVIVPLATLSGRRRAGDAGPEPNLTFEPGAGVPGAGVPGGGVPGGGLADLAFTGPIDREAARRLACDGAVARIVTDPKGLPIELGRRVRVVPGYLRRALAARDRGCVAPGCDRPPEHCDAHHLLSWLNGGPTDLANLVLLCPLHHRHVHEGRWRPTVATHARSPLPRGA